MSHARENNEQNDQNEQDEYVIETYRSNQYKEIFIGHIPQYVIKLVFTFLQLPNSKLRCKVTGINRGVKNACEICFLWLNEAVIWIKNRISNVTDKMRQKFLK